MGFRKLELNDKYNVVIEDYFKILVSVKYNKKGEYIPLYTICFRNINDENNCEDTSEN